MDYFPTCTLMNLSPNYDFYRLFHTVHTALTLEFHTTTFSHFGCIFMWLRPGKGITVHECTMCDKVFTLRSLFTRHLKAHSSDNSFRCHLCHQVCGVETVDTYLVVHSVWFTKHLIFVMETGFPICYIYHGPVLTKHIYFNGIFKHLPSTQLFKRQYYLVKHRRTCKGVVDPGKVDPRVIRESDNPVRYHEERGESSGGLHRAAPLAFPGLNDSG